MSYWPTLPEAIPRRGGTVWCKCCQWSLQLVGWRFEGNFPSFSRAVVIAAPHTTNWDFVLAMLYIGALRLGINWLGKHTIFRWPFGWLFRKMGGIPVDRREPRGMVGAATRLLESSESLLVAVTPEGTRSRVTRFKTGFYHIAVGAAVPIVPVYLDYSRRCIGVGGTVHTTGDMEADMKAITDFYLPYGPAAKRPEKFGLGEDS